MSIKWTWQIRVYKGFSLSASEHSYIKEVTAHADFSHLSWDSIQTNAMKRIKKKIYNQLKHEQKGRCAYCGTPIMREPADREHILPKEKYLKLMFNPYNIVLSCINCNRNLKGRYDSLAQHESHKRMATSGCLSARYSYESWHPFFHPPEEHFKYSGSVSKIIKSDTPQGNKHIELFRLSTLKSVEERTQFALIMEMRQKKRLKRFMGTIDAALDFRNDLGGK